MYKGSIFTLIMGTFYLLFTASTCEVPVELEDPPESKLILISEFTVGMPVEVRLSRSRSILDDPLSPESLYPSNAIVQIWKESESICTLEFDDSDPEALKYVSNFYPEIGVSYTIKAEVPGLEPISATNYIPAPSYTALFRIDNTYSHIDKLGGENPFIYIYDLFLEIEQSLDDEDNYYYIKFEYGVQVAQSIRVKTFELENRDNNNPTYIENHFGEGILVDATNLRDNLILRLRATARLPDENQPIKELYVEVRNISKDYYDFYSSASNQLQQSDHHPFINSPSPIHTNVENGYGYFAGYSAAKDTIPAN